METERTQVTVGQRRRVTPAGRGDQRGPASGAGRMSAAGWPTSAVKSLPAACLLR